MPSRRVLIWGLPILLLTAACGVPAPAAENAAKQFISQHDLPNGLHLTVAEDPLTDIAALDLVLDVSALDIDEDKAGIRQLIQQLSLDRLRAAVAQEAQLAGLSDAVKSGGSLAISCEDEYVGARASLPSNLLPVVLRTFADLFFAPQQFTAEELADAKSQVIGAYERSLNNAGEDTFRLFRRAFWGSSALADDTSTVLAGIASASSADITACLERLYVPSRAYLCVVSPSPAEQITPLVEEIFGQYKAGAQTVAPRIVNLPTSSVVRVGSGKDMQHAAVLLGVPLPPYGTRGFMAGQLAYILLGGAQGRLTEDRMMQRGFGLMLPQALYETSPPFKVIAPRPGTIPFIAVYVVADPLHIEDARVQVLSHIQAIRRGDFSEEYLQAAKDQLVNEYALTCDKYGSHAEFLNVNALFGAEPRLNADFAALVETVSAEDVTKVAQEYFANHAIGVQMPAN